MAGMLESILWRPGFNWRVSEILVLNPIQWTNLTRNEVKEITFSKGYVDLDQQHTQRRSRILVNVDWIVKAKLVTSTETPIPELRKMEAMAERYLANGKCNHRPFLGCREFPAKVRLVNGSETLPSPVDITRQLGRMPHSYRWVQDVRAEVFMFDAELNRGRLVVPEVA
jgi:CRISPR-associated protein Cas5d